jgi:hypothetical protein
MSAGPSSVGDDIMLGMARWEHVELTFWDVANKSQMLPPLTPEMVAAAESALGLVLPADFLRLLSIQNGGVVADAWDACPIQSTTSADDYAPLETVSGIGPPSVCWIDTEMHHDIQLAQSFRAFVERLTASAGFWS